MKLPQHRASQLLLVLLFSPPSSPREVRTVESVDKETQIYPGDKELFDFDKEVNGYVMISCCSFTVLTFHTGFAGS